MIPKECYYEKVKTKTNYKKFLVQRKKNMSESKTKECLRIPKKEGDLFVKGGEMIKNPKLKKRKTLNQNNYLERKSKSPLSHKRNLFFENMAWKNLSFSPSKKMIIFNKRRQFEKKKLRDNLSFSPSNRLLYINKTSKVLKLKKSLKKTNYKPKTKSFKDMNNDQIKKKFALKMKKQKEFDLSSDVYKVKVKNSQRRKKEKSLNRNLTENFERLKKKFQNEFLKKVVKEKNRKKKSFNRINFDKPHLNEYSDDNRTFKYSHFVEIKNNSSEKKKLNLKKLIKSKLNQDKTYRQMPENQKNQFGHQFHSIKNLIKKTFSERKIIPKKNISIFIKPTQIYCNSTNSNNKIRNIQRNIFFNHKNLSVNLKKINSQKSHLLINDKSSLVDKTPKKNFEKNVEKNELDIDHKKVTLTYNEAQRFPPEENQTLINISDQIEQTGQLKYDTYFHNNNKVENVNRVFKKQKNIEFEIVSNPKFIDKSVEKSAERICKLQTSKVQKVVESLKKSNANCQMKSFEFRHQIDKKSIIKKKQNLEKQLKNDLKSSRGRSLKKNPKTMEGNFKKLNFEKMNKKLEKAKNSKLEIVDGEITARFHKMNNLKSSKDINLLNNKVDIILKKLENLKNSKKKNQIKIQLKKHFVNKKNLIHFDLKTVFDKKIEYQDVYIKKQDLEKYQNNSDIFLEEIENEVEKLNPFLIKTDSLSLEKYLSDQEELNLVLNFRRNNLKKKFDSNLQKIEEALNKKKSVEFLNQVTLLRNNYQKERRRIDNMKFYIKKNWIYLFYVLKSKNQALQQARSSKDLKTDKKVIKKLSNGEDINKSVVKQVKNEIFNKEKICEERDEKVANDFRINKAENIITKSDRNDKSIQKKKSAKKPKKLMIEKMDIPSQKRIFKIKKKNINLEKFSQIRNSSENSHNNKWTFKLNGKVIISDPSVLSLKRNSAASILKSIKTPQSQLSETNLSFYSQRKKNESLMNSLLIEKKKIMIKNSSSLNFEDLKPKIFNSEIHDNLENEDFIDRIKTNEDIQCQSVFLKQNFFKEKIEKKKKFDFWTTISDSLIFQEVEKIMKLVDKKKKITLKKKKLVDFVSTNYIEEYSQELFQFLLLNYQKQIIEKINQNYGVPLIQQLILLSENHSVTNDLYTEYSNNPVISKNIIFNFLIKQKRYETFHKLHNKLICDCINEALCTWRPFATKGPIFGWQSRFGNCYLTNIKQNDLYSVFEVTLNKIIEWSLLNCGLYEYNFESVILESKRENNLVKFLCWEIYESDEKWQFFDKEEIGVLVNLDQIIFDYLLSDCVEEFLIL